MSNLASEIERARINVAERLIIQDLHDRGVCTVTGECEICNEALRRAAEPPIREPMPEGLEDKLATMLWFMSEIRSGRRDNDRRALESYLDDPQVAEWLSRMFKAGRVRNTRFTGK